MTDTSYNLKFCDVVSPVLTFAKWTGVLPLVYCEKNDKHSIVVCSFEVSKFWRIFSIGIQLIFMPFMVILFVDLVTGFNHTEVLWNAMKIMFIIHEIELYAILFLGVVQAKHMAKIMNQLVNIPSSQEDLKWIGRFMRIIMTIILVFFALYSSTNILHICIEMERIIVFSIRNFSRSLVGLVLHNYLAIFTQVQCMVSVMLCLLISSKFKYFTSLVRHTFNNKTTAPIINDNQKTVLVKTYNANLTSNNKNATIKVDTEFLEDLHKRYCEINDCLDDINERIGFQLLISISVILYSLIFFIFCEISIEGYNNDGILIFASVFGICVLIIRLSLYMWVGYKIKNQSMAPLIALQHARVLHFPEQIQQQIQTILLQWSSTEPGYLSAFQIMNVGPWLITSIIGNVITYLLVFIQISKQN